MAKDIQFILELISFEFFWIHYIVLIHVSSCLYCFFFPGLQSCSVSCGSRDSALNAKQLAIGTSETVSLGLRIPRHTLVTNPMSADPFPRPPLPGKLNSTTWPDLRSISIYKQFRLQNGGAWMCVGCTAKWCAMPSSYNIIANNGFPIKWFVLGV